MVAVPDAEGVMVALIKAPEIACVRITLALDGHERASSNIPTENKVAVAQSMKTAEVPTVVESHEHEGRVLPKAPIEDPRIREGQEREAALRQRISEMESVLSDVTNQAKESGYADGLTKGLAEGRAKAEEEYGDNLKALAKLVQAGRDSLSSILHDAEPLIADIVFSVVTKMVGDLFQSADARLAAVRHAIGTVEKDEIVSVRMSPEDIKHLREYGDAVPAWASILSVLPLEPDADIGIGGCHVCLKAGQLDARIETQFRRFAQSLKDAVARG